MYNLPTFHIKIEVLSINTIIQADMEIDNKLLKLVLFLIEGVSVSSIRTNKSFKLSSTYSVVCMYDRIYPEACFLGRLWLHCTASPTSNGRSQLLACRSTIIWNIFVPITFLNYFFASNHLLSTRVFEDDWQLVIISLIALAGQVKKIRTLGWKSSIAY